MAIKIPDSLKKSRKDRKGDGKINTEAEMIEAEEER